MRKLSRLYVTIIMILWVVSSTSCGFSSGLPSEAVGKKIFQGLLQKYSPNMLKFVSFEKTNGKMAYNDTQYQMEFTGVFEALQDCSTTTPNMANPYEAGQWINSGTLPPQLAYELKWNLRKGERRTLKHYLQFEKTEKGWRSLDLPPKD